MVTRTLGRSGIEVSALGVGTWAMGGPLWDAGSPRGWGPADDEASARALRRAFDLGITLYDTASNYGAGHAERVLGSALGGVRDQIVIATKWGYTFESDTRQATGEDDSPEFVRASLTASLRRLGTDYVDVFQLHLGGLDPARAAALRDVCEELVADGLIRAYGWSTDDPARAEVFAAGKHCTVVQAELNVLNDRQDMYPVLDAHDIAMLCKGPLAMGLLARSSWDDRLPTEDVRSSGVEWMRFFTDGLPSPEFLSKRDAVRDILTSDGRTLAQGALAWIWARCDRAVPIPGVRTVAQAEDNAGALAHGPLTPDQLSEVERILRA